MKIDFLVPDIFSPVIGPITTMAKYLQDGHQVRIVGPDLGHGICPMYRDAFPYTVVPTPKLYRLPEYFRERQKIADSLVGDVVVAVKAVADTLPVALLHRKQKGGKVVVYLDEWDGALMAMRSLGQKARMWLRYFHQPLMDNYFPLVEGLIGKADHVISTTRFLQNKFGGSILHLGVDCDFFRPQPHAAADALRAELGLEGKRLIVFGGVARPHKGLDWILEALANIGDTNTRFLIVGPINEHVKEMLAHPRWGVFVKAAGPQAQARMPLYLSLADLVILPQQDNLLAQSQMPCKVFEAMSMARPIVASAVADLPEVLDGCGWTVPAGDISRLVAAIQAVFSDPWRARAMGEAARVKCLSLYSRAATRQRLEEIVERVAADS